MKKWDAAAITGEVLRRPETWAGDMPFLPWGEGERKLAAYLALLLKWNRSLNLVGANEPQKLMACLVRDCFFLARFMERLADERQAASGPEIWDLGAGAGLPGIPLRIFFGRGSYVWVESRQKRALFLQNAQALLKLDRFNGFSGRAEDFFKLNQSHKADFIISRAFMPAARLMEFCRPCLGASGRLVIMANSEPDSLSPGWRLADSLSYHSNDQTRWLWACAPEA